MNHLFGKSIWSRPLILAVALCTASPGEAGTGASMSEVPEDYSYARALAPPGYWDYFLGDLTNTVAIEFATAEGGDWGLVKYCAIVTSQTYGTGDMLLYIPLSPERNIVEGSAPRFAIHSPPVIGIKATFTVG